MLINGIKIGNKLAYPGDITPGFDPNHIAAQGAIVSAVMLGSNPINLINGVPGTLVGAPAPPSVQTAIGPAMSTQWGLGQCITFTPLSTASVTQATLAGIFIPTLTQPSVSYGDIVNLTSNSLNALALLNSFNTTTSSPGLANGGGLVTLSGIPTFVLGHPYFFAVSLKNGASYPKNYVLVDLLTGQMWSGTGSNTMVPYAPVLCSIGGATSHGCNASVAAGMISTTYLTIPQLRQWALSPWDYWYPDNSLIV